MPRGLYSRLTADEIATVRQSWDRWKKAKEERQQVLRRFKLGRTYYDKIGSGWAGKKPRAQA